MRPKYEFTNETKIVNGHVLHRIRRLSDGELGGFIEKEDNLNQDGKCWIYGDALVWGNAIVCDDAEVYGQAKVYDNACVYDSAVISGDAEVYDNAQIYGGATVCNEAKVYGKAQVYGRALIHENGIVYDHAKVCGDTVIWKNQRIGSDEIRGEDE